MGTPKSRKPVRRATPPQQGHVKLQAHAHNDFIGTVGSKARRCLETNAELGKVFLATLKSLGLLLFLAAVVEVVDVMRT